MGFVASTRFCRESGFVANTRFFGFVLSRLLLRHKGFYSDFVQISAQKLGGWDLWRGHRNILKDRDCILPLQVLQLTQSAAKVEQGQQQWAGEAAQQQAQAAAQAYGASASYGSSYGSSYGYAQPAAPAPQPPGSIKWVLLQLDDQPS